MKNRKYNLFLLVLVLITILILPSKVNAKLTYTDQLKCTTNDNIVYNCRMGFEVTESPYQKNHIKVTLELTNMTASNFQVSSGYYLVDSSSSSTSNGMTYSYEFGSIASSQSVGFHEMATITLTKVMTAADCHREYHGDSVEEYDRTCQVLEKNNTKYYYDSDGELTTWKNYKTECDAVACQKVCEPGNNSNCMYFDNNKHEVNSEYDMKVACKQYRCEKANGNYFNNSGNQVTWKQYMQACNPGNCEKKCEEGNSSNCMYFNDKGVEVPSEYDMKVACKLYKCETQNNKYFDKFGNIVSWRDYKKACDPVSCSKVCEPNNASNCMYFDNENNEVASEHEMKVACKKYSCEEVNGQYFNKTGEEVTWREYQLACKKATCTSVCNPKSSTDCLYYNDAGESVSEHEMNVACKKYSCEYQNGHYYDKTGNEVSWSEYDKACGSHTCARVCDPNNNKNCLYYNKSKQSVTWQEYEKDCHQYSCQKVCEPGNNTNCLYYDKSGKNVSSEDEMNKSCTKVEEVHKCELYNNQYYNDNGDVVTWKEYKLACEPGVCQKVCNPKDSKDCLYFDKLGASNTETKYLQECLPHVCEKVGDLYYDKNGDIVASEEEMNKSCEERNICELKNGKYFDKEGNVTDKNGYLISCFTHKCEKIGDTFFDKDGKQVDADTYDKSCNPPIENPQTGWALPLIGLVLVGGCGLAIYKKTKKYNKFM